MPSDFMWYYFWTDLAKLSESPEENFVGLVLIKEFFVDFFRDETVTDDNQLWFCCLLVRSMKCLFIFVWSTKNYIFTFMILGIYMQLKSGEPSGGGAAPLEKITDLRVFLKVWSEGYQTIIAMIIIPRK